MQREQKNRLEEMNESGISEIKKDLNQTQNYNDFLSDDLRRTLSQQEELLVKQKDLRILELEEINKSLNLKCMQLNQDNERLQTLLSTIYTETEKIVGSTNDESITQNLQKLQKQITSSERSVYEEVRLREDKEYFQGHSENTNSYDIRISLNSMYDLYKKECKIQYFEKENKKREQIDSLNKCAVIGFQGVKNRGKTFLLNLLNEEKFPSAFYESTLGISAKVDIKPNSNKIYLDSEGVQKPAKFNWNEAYKQKVKKGEEETKFLAKVQEQVIQNFFDIKATEQLQQEFLLQSCEIVIVVVGMISIEDQKLISSIIDRRLPSQVIIVHNYKELKEVKYVERHIQDSLMFQFPLRMVSPDLKLNSNKEFNKVAYIDRRYDNVAHVIFANNKSEAGDYYNKFSLEYIRQLIQLNTKQKAFSMSDKFVKFLNDYLPNYIEFKDQIKSKVFVKKEVQQNEYVISLGESLEIKKIKDITLDVFGRIINAINFSVVEFQKEDVKYKKVDIELPGYVQFEQKNCMISNDEKGRVQLLIKAFKNTDPHSSEIQQIEDKRLYGEFILKLQIGKAEEKLTQIGPIINNKNGLYSLQFKTESSEIDCLVVQQEED